MGYTNPTNPGIVGASSSDYALSFVVWVPSLGDTLSVLVQPFAEHAVYVGGTWS